MEHVTFIVMLPGSDRIAVVCADIVDVRANEDIEREPIDIGTESFFKEAISKAVTKWVRQTDEGRKAYEETHGQLTIETLVNYLKSTSLGIALAVHGILSLRIEFADAGDGEWKLTDLLYNDKEQTDA